MGRVIRQKTPLRVAFENGMRELDDTRVKVGWFESSHYPDGTPVAYVAAIQEFGAAEQGIPARPTIRPTIAAQGAEWTDIMKRGATAIANGRRSTPQVLEALGAVAAGDVRYTMSNLHDPELAESTLAARRRRGNHSVKPLNDTGVLIPTLTHTVEIGN